MSKVGPSDVPGKKAGPNGSFPVGDPTHARLAIGGATRSFNAGNISKGTEEHIKAEARHELGKGRADEGGHRDGHTTSGMDKAMQEHADHHHPVKGR
jgi:hypothetical protein